MGYYVSHCESGSWALMQARPMQHIIDQATDTTLCGRTPEHGRWYGNPRQLTQQSFNADDCEKCALKAIALGIWTVPKKKGTARNLSPHSASPHAAAGNTEFQLDSSSRLPVR